MRVNFHPELCRVEINTHPFLWRVWSNPEIDDNFAKGAAIEMIGAPWEVRQAAARIGDRL